MNVDWDFIKRTYESAASRTSIPPLAEFGHAMLKLVKALQIEAKWTDNVRIATAMYTLTIHVANVPKEILIGFENSFYTLRVLSYKDGIYTAKITFEFKDAINTINSYIENLTHEASSPPTT